MSADAATLAFLLAHITAKHLHNSLEEGKSTYESMCSVFSVCYIFMACILLLALAVFSATLARQRTALSMIKQAIGLKRYNCHHTL